MSDVLCLFDLDEFGRDLDDPLAELEQDVVHMLLESFGTNCDAQTRSIGLEDALAGAANPSLRHFIETKLTDDPRIHAAEVTLTATTEASVRIDLRIQTNDSELGIALALDASGNATRIP